jgi:predicted nucleic acid-binding protein
VIYLDTSVALAHLLAEDRRPPDWIWQETLVASRLMEYELWNRLHAMGFAPSHGEAARGLVSQIALLELSPEVLQRALEPYPVRIRTLDALHLASLGFLQTHGQKVELATYDTTMADAARAMRMSLIDLP